MFRNAAKSDAGRVDAGGCVAVRQTASATRHRRFFSCTTCCARELKFRATALPQPLEARLSTHSKHINVWGRTI